MMRYEAQVLAEGWGQSQSGGLRRLPVPSAGGTHRQTGNRKCEPITIPLCKDIEYNETIFPNLMGNENQEEAGLEVHQYYPLVKVNCSKDIKFFLCAMYAPVCTILDDALPPCKELCLSAKHGCADLMRQFSFPWPNGFDCDKFPLTSSGLCVGENNNGKIDTNDLIPYFTTPNQDSRPQTYNEMQDFVCPAQLRVNKELDYKLSIGSSPRIVNVTECGAPCYRLFFQKDDIWLMQKYIIIFSTFCFAFTLFTITTFFIDTSQFPYPKKPIVYLSLCYLIVAIVYLIRGFVGNDSIACNEPFSPEKTTNNLEMEPVLKQSQHDWRCSVVGMILYFFIMAGAGWWVALTVAWYLSAGPKWGSEAIDVYASWFHGSVWTTASILTVIVLVWRKTEGDILSGVCFVGVLQTDSLMYLIIVPLALHLIVGSGFLLVGFCSLIGIRRMMKSSGNKTDDLNHLTRFIFRIGIFSFIYILCASTVLGCYIYEYMGIPNWMQDWQERICRKELNRELQEKWQVLCRYPDQMYYNEIESSPNWYIFLLKYGMINAIGIFSGFWVWSGKTVQTWKNRFPCCHGYTQAQV